MRRPARRPATTARLAAVAASGGLVLAGCSALGIEENTFESGPLPAVTNETASAVLADLDAVVNEANAARDPELLASVVTDPLLEITSLRYGLDGIADPDDADPAAPVEHLDPTVFVPRFTGYPQWFVVAAAQQPDAPVRLEVLSRTSSAATWSTSISTDLQVGVEFPTLALDDAGYVVPLTEAEVADLVITPDDLAAAHAALLGTGAVPDGTDEVAGAVAATLLDDPWTTARREADAQRVTAVGEAATVTAVYEALGTIPQVLRTEDGGALVLYAITEQVEFTVAPNFYLQLDEPTAAIVGAPDVRTSLTESWAAQLAVYVPPDDSTPARVVGATFDRTGLAGS